MLRHWLPLSLLAASGVVLSLLPAPAPAQFEDPPPFRREDPVGPPPPVPGEPEVQARGPVHEAFAMPAEGFAKPGPSIPKAPPEPIPEVPPEEAPQGEGAVWIPGYWAWDEDRGDFLWVSGIWRIAPPGRKWVPGYWSRTDSGYAWVSGFWAPTGEEELPYYEAPPAPLAVAPSLPPPDEFATFVPGIWIWRERWLWRPGYWLDPRPDWVYCPPRWCWTPRGYLFCSGYWDRPLVGRGVLFAPVWFGRVRPVVFTPRFVVGVNPLVNHLWIRPGFGYAFGDFYDPIYVRRGFTPWVTAAPRLRDPLFDHYRYVNRTNPRWATSLAAEVNNRFRVETARPPRTLVLQERAKGPAVVERLDRYRPEGIRLVKLDETSRTETRRLVEGIQKSAMQRRSLETRSTDRPRALPTRDIPAPRPVAPPRAETPKGPVSPPRAETPKGPVSPPRAETPKGPVSPPRPETPKGPVSPPRPETPKTPVAPPRPETPKGPVIRPETPKTPVAPPRPETPKGPVSPPRPETPKGPVSPPRPETPKGPVSPPRPETPKGPVIRPETPKGPVSPPRAEPSRPQITPTPPPRTPATPPTTSATPPRYTPPQTPPSNPMPPRYTPPAAPATPRPAPNPPAATPRYTPPSNPTPPRYTPPPVPSRYTPPAATPRSTPPASRPATPPSRPATAPSRPTRPGGR
ncbi:MAG: hypothetical protein SNJ75_11835 [Gemmataceae bacterium]